MQEDISQIIYGCLKRDRHSQSKLYELYAPKMLGVCMRYCPNREEAEELVQEGFCKIFKYIDGLRNTNNPEAWIRKIIVNSALQRYIPKTNLYPILNFDFHDIDVERDAEIYGNLNAKDIIGAIQKLPISYRMVFNLYVFEGYKHQEIAEILKISEGTSKSNLFAARASLQKLLGNYRSVKIYKG